MKNQNQRISIDFGAVDIFPAILDYDFIKKRPRGGSSRIDFFCYGRLSGILEKVETLPHVYVRKDNIFFEKGIFLLDFATMFDDIDGICDMIKAMGQERVYIEDSSRFRIDKLLERLTGIEIVRLSFS